MGVPVHLRSHWLTEALGAEPIEPEPLVGEARADVCILGGGYTGMWTALRLKALEPALDVVILEKDICGSGASGRNAGFVLSWASKFLTLEKVCGPQEGLRLLRASQEAVEEIVAHPDDEVLGCGASIKKWTLAGQRVDIIIMAEGATARDSIRNRAERSGEIVNLRIAAEKAGGKLGAAKRTFTISPHI